MKDERCDRRPACNVMYSMEAYYVVSKLSARRRFIANIAFLQVALGTEVSVECFMAKHMTMITNEFMHRSSSMRKKNVINVMSLLELPNLRLGAWAFVASQVQLARW